MVMQSEDHHDHKDSTAEQEKPALRPIVKVNETRSDRLSSDHIHLSPRAQRRIAMGRRSGS